MLINNGKCIPIIYHFIMYIHACIETTFHFYLQFPKSIIFRMKSNTQQYNL